VPDKDEKSKVDVKPEEKPDGSGALVDPKIADLMKDPDKLKELLHERSKLLGESQKYLGELNKLEKAKKDSEDAALADQGKFKEIAEKYKSEVEAVKKTFAEQRKDFELKFEAQKAGIIDAGDAVRLCDRAGLKLSDDFSAVEGAKETVEALKKAKPYLFGDAEEKIAPPDIAKASLKNMTPGQVPPIGSISPAERIGWGLKHQKK
jgi:hypothetical protein